MHCALCIVHCALCIVNCALIYGFSGIRIFGYCDSGVFGGDGGAG